MLSTITPGRTPTPSSVVPVDQFGLFPFSCLYICYMLFTKRFFLSHTYTSSGAASGSKDSRSHAISRGVSFGVSRARAVTTMTESVDDTTASRKNAATARVRSGAYQTRRTVIIIQEGTNVQQFVAVESYQYIRTNTPNICIYRRIILCVRVCACVSRHTRRTL